MVDDVTLEAICAQCGNPYEPNSGRGRRSSFCDDCRRERAKIRASARAYGVMSAQMIEVSLLYGAELTRKRVEVAERQNGRCVTCGRKRKLLLKKIGPDVVGVVGLCIECFMKEVHGGDTGTSQEDAEGVQRRGSGRQRRVA